MYGDVSMVNKTQVQRDLKINNLKVVFNLIESSGGISRANIAKEVRMSSTSITRIVSDLSEQNLILESHTEANRLGRSSTILRLTTKYYYFVCANIDSNKIELSIINLSGETICYINEKITNEITAEELCDCLLTMYNKLLTDTKLERSSVVAMGVSIIGFIDKNDRNVILIPQFGWTNIPLFDMLTDRFGIDIYIDNNAKSVLRGAMSQISEYSRCNVVFMDVGTGVGAAFASYGAILEGAQNTAGEIGHIIIQPDGLPCDCGRRGCLQTYIAEGAITERAKAFDKSIEKLSDVFTCFEKGLPWAVKLIEDVTTYISIAIINLSCTFNPDVVLVSGQLFACYPFLFEKSIQNLKTYMFAAMDTNLKVELFKPANNTNLYGAFQFAKDRFVNTLLQQINTSL